MVMELWDCGNREGQKQDRKGERRGSKGCGFSKKHASAATFRSLCDDMMKFVQANAASSEKDHKARQERDSGMPLSYIAL